MTAAQQPDAGRHAAVAARDAALVEAWRGGDARALEQLMRLYEGLVRSRAGRQARRATACDQEDIAQEARVALVQAASTFNTTAGSTFAAYAQASVDRAVRIGSLCNGPDPMLSRGQLAHALGSVTRAVAAERAQAPEASPAEVAERAARRAGVRPDLAAHLLRVAAGRPVDRLDAPVGDDDSGTSLLDLLAAPGNVAQDLEDRHDLSLARMALRIELDALPPRMRDIMLARLADPPATFAEIGDRHGGVTRQRAEQLYAMTLHRVSAAVRRRLGLPGGRQIP